jgi:hypothetical protein
MAVKSLIETVTVGAGGAASIEFTAIPQDGSDLQLLFSLRNGTATNFSAFVKVNGSSTGYPNKVLYGSGSTVGTYSNATTDGWESVHAGNDMTANTFGNGSAYLSNYTSSAYKSGSVDSVGENNASNAYQMLTAGSWSDTSPITQVSLVMVVGNLAEYSTASLYKIKYD